MNVKPAIKLLLAALLAASFGMSGAAAGTPPVDPLPVPERVTSVQSDCYAVGAQVAASNGGQLAGARAATRGGQNVCVIVVLIPAKDGQRGKRRVIVVPQ